MKKRPKIYVEENFHQFEPHDLTLQALTAIFALGEGYKNVRIHAEPYGYDGGAEYFLRGARLETDLEYARRIEREDREAEAKRKRRETIEAKERAEFARLQKKYGNG